MSQELTKSATNKGFLAGGTITEGNPVKLDSAANTVVVCTGATDQVIGFATDTVSSGETVNVLLLGPTKKMIAAAAISKGDYVGIDSSTYTKINTLTLDGTGTTQQQILGIALEAAAADGDKIEVMIGVSLFTV